MCNNQAYYFNLYLKEIIMDLSNPTFWLAVLSTWITGALLTRLYLKKRSELKTRKVPVRIRVRGRRRD
jgi:hypothetical protein